MTGVENPHRLNQLSIRQGVLGRQRQCTDIGFGHRDAFTPSHFTVQRRVAPSPFTMTLPGITRTTSDDLDDAIRAVAFPT
jgi:hypothetical protein